MKLDNFLEQQHEDDNLFWRLSPADHQSLLDQALERIEEIEKQGSESVQHDPKENPSSEAIVSVRYYAWISSKGEKDFFNENEDVLFAGMIKNVPNKYKPLPEGANGRHYCVITKAH